MLNNELSSPFIMFSGINMCVPILASHNAFFPIKKKRSKEVCSPENANFPVMGSFVLLASPINNGTEGGRGLNASRRKAEAPRTRKLPSFNFEDNPDNIHPGEFPSRPLLFPLTYA